MWQITKLHKEHGRGGSTSETRDVEAQVKTKGKREKRGKKVIEAKGGGYRPIITRVAFRQLLFQKEP